MNTTLSALRTARKWLKAALDNEPEDYDNVGLKRAVTKVEQAMMAESVREELTPAQKVAPQLLAALRLCERALTPSRNDADLIAADDARAAIAAATVPHTDALAATSSLHVLAVRGLFYCGGGERAAQWCNLETLAAHFNLSDPKQEKDAERLAHYHGGKLYPVSA